MAMLTKNNHDKTAEFFFEKWSFPNSIGKHICITHLAQSGNMYYNYKHDFSIVLEGVSDSHYRLVCTEVGAFHKQSDGGTFQSSI